MAAISAADAARFGRLGVPAERRTVMGDARFDQVWWRARESGGNAALMAPLRDLEGAVLVAGSTWPADEDRLIEALAGIRDARPGELRLVLVPHEPTPAHLQQTEALLARHSFSSARLGSLRGAPPRAEVVLVDRVGVLGDLYALADLAYVGGGWGSAGLHSVLEPAAFGVPVLFGPRFANAREAGQLVAAGAAWSVRTTAELEERVGALLAGPDVRRAAGRAAGAYVEAGLGAAGRGAAVVGKLLEARARGGA